MADGVTQNVFADFFQEDAKEIQDIVKSKVSHEPVPEDEKVSYSEAPSFPKAKEADESKSKMFWSDLQQFFLEGKNQDNSTENYFPALLSKYRDQGQAQKEYPIWVAEAEWIDLNPNLKACQPLRALFDTAIETMKNRGDSMTILPEHTASLVGLIREELKKDTKPASYYALVENDIAVLSKKLELKGGEARVFENECKKFLKTIPLDGFVIPFSNAAPFHIAAAVIGGENAVRQASFKRELASIKAQISDVLALESSKGASKEDAAHDSSWDLGGGTFNVSELSSTMISSGTESMDQAGIERLKNALNLINEAEDFMKFTAYITVESGLDKKAGIDWKENFQGCDLKEKEAGTICSAVSEAFATTSSSFAELIKNIRIAKLELVGKYTPSIHDNYYSNFSWRNCSEEEIAAFPPQLIVCDSNSLLDNELSAFSKMLASNVPIKTLALRFDDKTELSDDFVYRQELGTLTVSYRNTFTVQASPLSPSYLYERYDEGLKSYAPALFHVLSVSQNVSDPYLWMSAAIEGREFPGFIYRGGITSNWGSRFDISENTQSDKKWAMHELNVKGEDAQDFAFTYADFASMQGSLKGLFKAVPAEYWNDDLVAFADYLELSENEITARVPFIWMVDEENTLQKVAVSWSLVMAARERLDFWQHIRENGGVDNYHVEKAMENALAELKKEANKELEELKAKQEAELEEARTESAESAMEKLTSILLDMDTSTMLGSVSNNSATPARSVKQTPKSEDGTAEETPSAVEEEDDDMSLGEPYIDTPLCTSCNECTDLNNRMFNYDADKMAFVADPTAGTFAELVQAAELCPVSIIHPGAPMNPNEPNLEELVKAAAKFN